MILLKLQPALSCFSGSIQDCLDNNDFWSTFDTRTTLAPDAWLTHEDDTCLTWEDWEETKDLLKTIGIVMVVVSLISLVCGLLLLLLMFTSMCKKDTGRVHQQQVMTSQAPGVIIGSSQVRDKGADACTYSNTSLRDTWCVGDLSLFFIVFHRY